MSTPVDLDRLLAGPPATVSSSSSVLALRSASVTGAPCSVTTSLSSVSASAAPPSRHPSGCREGKGQALSSLEKLSPSLPAPPGGIVASAPMHDPGSTPTGVLHDPRSTPSGVNSAPPTRHLSGRRDGKGQALSSLEKLSPSLPTPSGGRSAPEPVQDPSRPGPVPFAFGSDHSNFASGHPRGPAPGSVPGVVSTPGLDFGAGQGFSPFGPGPWGNCYPGQFPPWLNYPWFSSFRPSSHPSHKPSAPEQDWSGLSCPSSPQRGFSPSPLGDSGLWASASARAPSPSGDTGCWASASAHALSAPSCSSALSDEEEEAPPTFSFAGAIGFVQEFAPDLVCQSQVQDEPLSSLDQLLGSSASAPSPTPKLLESSMVADRIRLIQARIRDTRKGACVSPPAAGQVPDLPDALPCQKYFKPEPLPFKASFLHQALPAQALKVSQDDLRLLGGKDKNFKPTSRLFESQLAQWEESARRSLEAVSLTDTFFTALLGSLRDPAADSFKFREDLSARASLCLMQAMHASQKHLASQLCLLHANIVLARRDAFLSSAPGSSDLLRSLRAVPFGDSLFGGHVAPSLKQEGEAKKDILALSMAPHSSQRKRPAQSRPYPLASPKRFASRPSSGKRQAPISRGSRNFSQKSKKSSVPQSRVHPQ